MTFQGTPTKGETPRRGEKKEDKENLSGNNSAFPKDSDITQDSLVNESFNSTMNQDKYSSIAKLDDELEDEKWEERTAVITKNDHEEYLAAASSILDDLIGDVGTVGIPPVKRLVSSYCLKH